MKEHVIIFLRGLFFVCLFILCVPLLPFIALAGLIYSFGLGPPGNGYER